MRIEGLRFKPWFAGRVESFGSDSSRRTAAVRTPVLALEVICGEAANNAARKMIAAVCELGYCMSGGS